MPAPSVLGLDTSTRAQSVALSSGGTVLGQVGLHPAVTHSETIVRAVNLVMAGAGLRPRDLAAIAVTSGPGSFTGLRIGIATAKGLALASGVPLAGFSTLAVLGEALAEAAAAEAPAVIVALVDAGRGQVYRGIYRCGARGEEPVALRPLGPESACQPEEALAGVPLDGGVILGGDGALNHRDRLRDLPSRAVFVDETPFLAPKMARMADALHAVSRLGEHPPATNYIRPPDTLRRAPA